MELFFGARVVTEMAQSSYEKLKGENLILTALLKRASGEPLTKAETEILVEVAKSRALEIELRQKFELGGAIEKALFGSPNTARSDAVAKSVEDADTLESAVAKSFRGTNSSLTDRRTRAIKDAVFAPSKPTKKAAPAEKISNVRADIEGKPRQSCC